MLAYAFEGSARIGPNGTTLEEGQLAILGAGDSVRLSGAGGPGRLLLLGGIPLREPVARYGPFVMNTRAELVQAVEDYQSGKMGEITRSAEIRGEAAL
jgi:quercetin 2,3-dioxygenase